MLGHACLLARKGYTPVSVDLGWDNNKKKLSFPYKAWQTATPCTPDSHPMVSDSYNGLVLVTGQASDLVVIDTDRAKAGVDAADGLEHFREVVSRRGPLPDNTVVAATGSGGRHYLFSYSKSVAAGLRPDVPGRSMLTIDGVRATIDSRINNNCIICPPTTYSSPHGQLSYRWLTDLSDSKDLPALPLWLIDDLNAPQTKRPRALDGERDQAKRICTALDARCDQFRSCTPLLRKAGFREPRLTRTKADGFDFVADRTCVCPLCQNHHDTSEWYSIFVCDGLYQVRGYSSRCREQLLGLDNQPQLRKVFLNPQSDGPYCEIFASRFQIGRHEQPIIWTGQRWLQFGGHGWKPVEAVVVRAGLISVTQEKLAKALKQMEAEADIARDKGASETALARYKAIVKGIGYVGRGGNQRNILDCLKMLLFKNVGEEPTGIPGKVMLDGNPYLLGCDNGVIDLKTCTLRPGRPEDWLCKSVRYDFQPTEEGRAFVERTMSQTFPVDEERAFMQRYAGYCLLGCHPEKRYMMITDLPGKRSGNNGKTTLNSGLRHALGPDYACTGIDATLYADGGMRDENSCTPGRMHYRGLRLATFEELDAKKRLDTTRLKNLHGGGAVETGRDAYGKSVESFDWTAKFLISFNIANLPAINFEDHVHMGRMLVMRCRSKFLPADQLTGEPNTFEEIPGFGDQLKEHRSALLAWALEGLGDFWVKRLENVPPIMHVWKRELTGSQDLVKVWIRERLLHTGDANHFVKRADLYQDYKAFTEEERDKKHALGKQRFFHKLLLEMGEECHKDQLKRDGVNHTSCFVHWTMVG